MEPNDHREIGKRLDLFHIQEEGRGMVFWHPRGNALYRVVEDLVRSRMAARGYREVRTPQLLDRSFWEESGHWAAFGHAMFSVSGGDGEDGRPMAVKPMNCPGHIQVFKQGVRSYRDLPMRLNEFGTCHRNEPSGSLHGLLRTRSFVQDDAHVFCTEDQVEGEVSRYIGMLRSIYAEFGFGEFDVALSLRPEKRFGDDALWNRAEAMLASAAAASGVSPALQPGEGAFYGPKLEFALTDRAGRRWQCGTIQLDFVLPERMGASYVAADGGRAFPVLLHHAVLGSLERFIGMLLEHHEGRLPFFLAPEQVAVLPVSERQASYAAAVADEFSAAGFRVSLVDSADTLSRRIVDVRAAEIPVLAVVGKREEADLTVSIKVGNGEAVAVPLDGAARATRELCAA